MKSTKENSCDINAKSSCCSNEDDSPRKDLKVHWDRAYEKTTVDKLGWYEDFPEPSLQLIEKCYFNSNARLLNVGVGATTLIDELLKKGNKNIIAIDISDKAIDELKTRLKEQSNKVEWIIDDLMNPNELNKLEPVDLWHDRAVLHFFNDQKEQDKYFSLLKKLVKQNGFVIIAVFNLNGAEKCSGLPVFRYNEKMLSEKLGFDFSLKESFDFIYTMPSGDKREYLYALFQRN
ncbi:MAG: class I SAM-dependent methyltransferase [Bacteroidetes bacterium]|nr:MAG: class I SAM-dependent methyltransferase [Bacteroidota bacterium]